MTNEIEIKRTVKYNLPTVPNFIIAVNQDDGRLPVKNLTAEEAEEIGEMWKQALISKSQVTPF